MASKYTDREVELLLENNKLKLDAALLENAQLKAKLDAIERVAAAKIRLEKEMNDRSLGRGYGD